MQDCMTWPIVFLRFYTQFIIGSERSPPAILPKVCVGPSTSPQHQGRVSISWDSLPCHLQNGADVTSYIIQYTRLSTGVVIKISSFHRDVNCRQEVGGLYSCVVAELLIPSNQAYSIQVAAQNRYGEGSFMISDPINVSVPVFCRCYLKNYGNSEFMVIYSLSGMTCTYSDASDGIVSTTSGLTSSDNYGINTISISQPCIIAGPLPSYHPACTLIPVAARLNYIICAYRSE